MMVSLPVFIILENVETVCSETVINDPFVSRMCFKQWILKKGRIHVIVFASTDDDRDGFGSQKGVDICQKAFRSFLYEMWLSLHFIVSVRICVCLVFMIRE